MKKDNHKLMEAGPADENMPDPNEKVSGEKTKIPNDMALKILSDYSMSIIADLATISPKDNDIYKMILNSANEKSPSAFITNLKKEASGISVKNEATDVKNSAMEVFDKMIDFSKQWENINKQSGPETYTDAVKIMVDTTKKNVEAIKKIKESK
jgi:hypothetical protein